MRKVGVAPRSPTPAPPPRSAPRPPQTGRFATTRLPGPFTHLKGVYLLEADSAEALGTGWLSPVQAPVC